jgi:hypothetical protein
MPETKGSLLRFAIAYALRSVRLHVGRRFLKLGLSEEQRYAVADDTIRELRKCGAYKDLDDVITPPPLEPRWRDGKPEA